MKPNKLLFSFHLTVILILFTGVVEAQTAPDEIRAIRRAAFVEFSASHEKAISRWNYESDRLETVFDRIGLKTVGTPLELVEGFIASNSELLGLGQGHTLALERTTQSSGGGIRFWYQQYYNDLKVLTGGYLFAVNRKIYGTPVLEDPDGTTTSQGQIMCKSDESPNYFESRNDWFIYYVKGTFGPDIIIEIEPEISEASAKSSSLSDLGHQVTSEVNTFLAIQIDKSDPMVQSLIYQTAGITTEGNEFESQVDAFNGEVLNRVIKRGGGVVSEDDDLTKVVKKYAPTAPFRTSPCYPMTDMARA